MAEMAVEPLEAELGASGASGAYQPKHAHKARRMESRVPKHATAQRTTEARAKAAPKRTATAAIGAPKNTARAARKPASRAFSLPTTDKRRTSPFRKATSRSPALLAEYLAGVLIISITLFTQSGTKGYQTVITDVMMRLSALTAVFFVLFLMTGSKRGGEAAMWFGLLVDLGIVYKAAQSGDIGNFALLVSGKGLGVGATTLTSNTQETEVHETADAPWVTQSGS
jgi:hypothetical protein